MAHLFMIERNWYGEKENLYRYKKLVLNEGVTILCGCNGSGKTTLLQQIKYSLEKEHIPYIRYDNLNDGGLHARQAMLYHNNPAMLATSACSSEGENIIINIGNFAGKMRKFIDNNKNAQEVFILIDAADSGLSIDYIVELKALFNAIVKDAKEKGTIPYIVVSANTYELAKDEPCLNISSFKYTEFKTYNSYRKFIIKTRNDKNKRYGLEEWSE